jgi:hypothetical protein
VKYKEDVWIVLTEEVTVCDAHKEGTIVVIDLRNRSDGIVSLGMPPLEAKGLGELLIRAYKESQKMWN